MPSVLQQSSSPLQPTIIDETLGSNEFGSPDSPLMQPMRLRCIPTPSPPPAEACRAPDTRFGPGFVADSQGPRGQNEEPRLGDPMLVSLLGNGRDPFIAQEAGTRTLPPIDSSEGRGDRGDRQLTPEHSRRSGSNGKLHEDSVRDDGIRDRPSGAEMGKGSLQHLAAGALEAVQVAVDDPPNKAESSTAADISTSTRELSLHDEQPSPGPGHTQGVSRHKNGPPFGAESRPPILSPPSAGLPPIVSPGSESNGRSLPSIRSTLGDIKLPPPDQDLTGRHGHISTYPHSPPAGARQLPPLSGGHGSPPISPPDSYPRSLPSPRSLPASSPYTRYANSLPHRPSVDYSSSTGGEVSGTEQNVPPPPTSTSAVDRMSIDGITNQGVYACHVTGCKAPPFQTQYLLNSHANVHSSARPHYCPVPGCARSEGGKGFKRKNEMIRHGLVHDSPGYVCPFCPDKDHKYPRPDNLQR